MLDQQRIYIFFFICVESKERIKAFAVLRKKGNYEFNTNAALNNGELIVSRRPNSRFNRNASDYSICHCCLGTYSKTSTRQHVCARQKVKGDRSSIELSRMVEGRLLVNASATLQKILSKKKDGPITNLIKYDWLLITFGNELAEQYDFKPQHKMVRSRLSLLGRVLTKLKCIEPTITDFASLYNAELCDSVIEAIRFVGGFNATTRYFKTPSTASDAVTQVKAVGKILKDNCITNRDKKLKEQTDDFISVFTSRATKRINKLVKNTKQKMKREKTETLPTTEDINILSRYLDQKRSACFKCLVDGFSIAKWIDLSKVTMASILLFNRRRVGEMQNSLVTDFTGRRKIKENSKDQQFLALTAEGKERAKQYSRMEIRGKLDTPVPVLLRGDAEKCLDLMLSHRDAAGIYPTNQLLYALPSSNPDDPKCIDACVVLKKFADDCGAEDPKTLRGTKLRKHFATFCGIKEVNDSTVTDIASFMGHSELVHKQFYRGNPMDRQIVKMSGLLEEASGKSEIVIDDYVNTGNDIPLQVEARDPLVNNKVASKRKQQPEEDEFVPSKCNNHCFLFQPL